MKIEIKTGKHKLGSVWFDAFDIHVDQMGIIHVWNADIDGKGQYAKLEPSDDHVEIVIDRLKERVQ